MPLACPKRRRARGNSGESAAEAEKAQVTRLPAQAAPAYAIFPYKAAISPNARAPSRAVLGPERALNGDQRRQQVRAVIDWAAAGNGRR